MRGLSFHDIRAYKAIQTTLFVGLPVYFIEPLHPAKFFWRGQFYSEPDDFRRFTYFCRAAMEFLLQSGKRPDIIHDWQTAVVVTFSSAHPINPFFFGLWNV
jgi:starch synthase